jgi:pimeloyl-ACP methyl ester carboxylesterase
VDRFASDGRHRTPGKKEQMRVDGGTKRANLDWLGALQLLSTFRRNLGDRLPQTVVHSGTEVDIYQPDRAPRATAIFVPGLAIRGREDPRIRNLGWALCATGLRVLIPDVPSIRALKISVDQPDEVQQLLESLVADSTMVTTPGLSLLSVSFSGIFVLRAALSAVLAQRLRALCLIGGYFDIERVASFLITSDHADPYGRLIIARSYYSGDDPALAPVREVLSRCVEASALDNTGPSDLDTLFDTSDPVEAGLHRLLTDPHERQSFCRQVVTMFNDSWSGYRVPGDFPLDMPPVFLLHGRQDRVIPPQESCRLAQLLQDGGVSHRLCVTDFLGHGDAVISLARLRQLYRLLAGFAWFLGYTRD